MYCSGSVVTETYPASSRWIEGEEILTKIQRAWKTALGENKDVTII
jgi:hypothetical protein